MIRTPNQQLSKREAQILELYAAGDRDMAIAAKISRSAKTVQSHKRRICLKKNVQNHADWLKLLYSVIDNQRSKSDEAV